MLLLDGGLRDGEEDVDEVDEEPEAEVNDELGDIS
jgi:hypothetical protein